MLTELEQEALGSVNEEILKCKVDKPGKEKEKCINPKRELSETEMVFDGFWAELRAND